MWCVLIELIVGGEENSPRSSSLAIKRDIATRVAMCASPFTIIVDRQSEHIQCQYLFVCARGDDDDDVRLYKEVCARAFMYPNACVQTRGNTWNKNRKIMIIQLS